MRARWLTQTPAVRAGPCRTTCWFWNMCANLRVVMVPPETLPNAEGTSWPPNTSRSWSSCMPSRLRSTSATRARSTKPPAAPPRLCAWPCGAPVPRTVGSAAPRAIPPPCHSMHTTSLHASAPAAPQGTGEERAVPMIARGSSGAGRGAT